MRRFVALALALLLTAGVAGAQTLDLGTGLPGGNAAASVSVVNTATATTIYSVTVPGKLYGHFASTQYGATRLHTKLIGYLSTHNTTDSVPRVNVGCNYGGTTATIALMNALAWPKGLSSVPLTIDLWVAANDAGTGQVLFGNWATGTNTNATASSGATNGMALVIGTTGMTVNRTLICTWQWASAASLNGVTISNGYTVVGE